MKFISPFELKVKIDQGEPLLIVDIREKNKFEEAHITGAINITQMELPEKLQLIPTDRPVILYCLYGIKSHAPYLYLTEKMKYRNIFVLEGGISQWENDIDTDVSMP